MNTSLHIVFFASTRFPQGTFFRWHNLALGLKQLGHEVTVFTFDKDYTTPKRTEQVDGIIYHILPSTKGQSFFDHNTHPGVLVKGLFRSLPKADVYHTFQPFPISTLPAYYNRSKARLFVYDWDDLWYGGLMPEGFSGKFFPGVFAKRAVRFIEHFMPSKSTLVTVCSNFLKQRALALGSRNVEIVYNGFWDHAAQLSRSEARNKLQLKDDAYYFGFMGRTINELEWCYEVLRVTPDTHYRLALCGMDKSLMEKCPAELLPRIDFLGQLTPENARIFSLSINCGLLPLENTTFNKSRFPIKFAEYLANGASVICSDVGEVAVLAKKIGGVKLAGTSLEEWKEAIAAFFKEAQAGVSYQPDKELFGKELNWTSIAKGLEKIYLDHLPADKK